MKKKAMNMLLGGAVALSLTVSAPASLWAEETTEAAQESETVEKEEEVKEETVVIALEEGKTLEVKNVTGISVESAVLEETEGESDAEVKKNLVLKEAEEGTEHIFEDVKLDEVTEPVLTEEEGFWYLNYKDQNNKEQEAAETGEERELEEPVTMYAFSDVNVREKADTESKALKVAALGSEWTAVAVCPQWYRVESGDVKGYVFHKYLTRDKDAVDAKIKEKQEAAAAAAQAQAEAAAAAAAQAAAEQAAAEQAAAQQPEAQEPAAPEPEQPASQEVYEVSRVAYDDCDGSGHGYYEITYSDGSVAYEEY